MIIQKKRTNTCIFNKKRVSLQRISLSKLQKNVILGSIARTRVPKYDYQGIQIIDLAEWLLGK